MLCHPDNNHAGCGCHGLPRRMRAITFIFALITAVLTPPLGAETPPTASAPSQPAQRVISFSPALTQTVVDLGRADWLVAAAEHDDAAPLGLPIIGNQWQPNVERLLGLHPTLVLVMTAKEGVHPRLAELADVGQFTLWTCETPSSAQEAIDAIDGGQIAAVTPSLADVLAASDRGRQLAADLRNLLRQLADLAADRPTPRVLLVIGTDPLWVSGPGSVEDDLLSYVGATNAAADVAGRAAAIDREKLLTLRPDVVIILSPNGPPLERLGQDPRLAVFERLDIPAVVNHRFHLIDDPRCMLIQGSALGPVAIQIAKAIHPDLVEQIDALPPVALPCATNPCSCETPADD